MKIYVLKVLFLITHIFVSGITITSAQQNEGEVLFFKGLKAFYSDNDSDAFKYFQEAAGKNYPEAYTMLGQLHYVGIGTKRNHKLAVDTWQKAISLGDKKANLLLGYAYYHGQGVLEDVNEAANLWRKCMNDVINAADQGNLFWSWRLAECYLDGYGVAKNEELGMKYYRKATEGNYTEAQFWLGKKYEVKKNYAEAMLWYRKAAALGSKQAKHEIGYMYYIGRGVKEDDELAFTWFKEASDAGYTVSTGYIANMYDKGHYVERDWNEAFKYYTLYYERGGRGNDIVKLGEFYVFGVGGAKQDLKKALELFSITNDKLGKVYIEILSNICKQDKYNGRNTSGDILEVSCSNGEPELLQINQKRIETFSINFKSSQQARVWPTSAILPEFEKKKAFDEISFSGYSPSKVYTPQENSGSLYIISNDPRRSIGYMYVVAAFDTGEPITVKIPMAVCWLPE
jgi:TPR repeat protein